MNNLTTAQKVYLAALLAAAGAWIGLQIGIPVYEYNHGKSPLTALLAHLSDVSLLAGLAIIAIGFAVQSVGVLPTAWRGAQQPTSSFGWPIAPMGSLRNLAIWIVIALLLVFLFNLFSGGHPSGHANPPPPAAPPVEMPSLLAIFINWFPMLLIFGVWLVFLRQMKARQGNNDDKSNKF
jgi:hypothetical protein